MTNPTVSVIIPNYNQARYVGEAIQSVLDQTYRSFEIIVVDDGSTDNSRELVSQFGPKLGYLWQENQGLGAARNQGIRAARGELVGLLDADDRWSSHFLETMVSLATRTPEATVYYCSAQGIDANGCEVSQVFGGPVKRPEAMYQTLLRANFLIPSTTVMRRSAVEAAGLFEQSIRSMHGCEDWDLWLRLLPKHLFVGTWECLVQYRLHGESLSSNSVRMKQAVQAVIEKNFGLDDGQWHNWSDEKRRAYGGVYRYHLLSSVKRQSDWESGALYLTKALQADPTLSVDLDLFYDLALASLPLGYRGDACQLDLLNIAGHVLRMIEKVFNLGNFEPASLLRQTYGTAHYAMGLIAYNTGQRSLSRHFLLSALHCAPGLLRDKLLLGNLLKSFISRPVLERFQRLLEFPTPQGR